MTVCILGAGNVAFHLTHAFIDAGHEVLVWNRSEGSLASMRKLGAKYCTTRIEDIPKDLDLYLISVKDDAVTEVLDMLRGHLPSNVKVAHTAGSLSVEIVEKRFTNCGVLYPMQTFTKGKELKYSEIPFFIEEKNEMKGRLKILAESVSDRVYELNSSQRRYLHLASVFACNFSNHCYTLSESVISKIGLPFSVMLPLVDETVAKVKQLNSPVDCQTGPAVREDAMVMEAQKKLLEDQQEKNIYELMSLSIIDYKHK